MSTNVTSNLGPAFQFNNTGVGAQHNNSNFYTETSYQDEQNRKCLQDLRLSDPRDDKTRIETANGGLLREASDWILIHNDFLKWTKGDARLFWIKGDPGKGKTMLLLTIVKELERQLEQSDSALVLSYFFCHGTDQNLNNATAILRGLLYLLVSENRYLISHIRSRYDDAGKKLFEEDSFFILSEMLESILCDKSLPGAYIIIDALDECTPENRDPLLKLIARLTEKLPHVRWAVSIRNKPDIEEYLTLDASGMKLGLEITENAQQVSRAVNAFIDNKLSKIQSLRDDNNKRRRVQEIMREKANGTFLWVALVVKQLEKAKSWQIMAAVEKLPTGLTELYRLIISDIKHKSEWEYCRLILSAVTLAYRPLHVTELAVLSGLPDEISANVRYVREIISLCSSLLTIQGDFVYLIHRSAKDYLSGAAANVVFPTGLAEAHCRMTELSLQAMQRILRRDIYNLRQPGIYIDEIEVPSPDQLVSIRYCCVHWISHFCGFCHYNGFQNQEKLGKLVDDFLRQFYLYWLEALGLLRYVGDGILLLTRLRNLVKKQSRDQQLVDLVEDSYQFISQNRWVIEHAPLQIYASALVFSPTESLTRQLFAKEEPDWIRIKPIVERTWGPCWQTLEGHCGSVCSVAFSPDSKLLASGSGDGTVQICDAVTGTLQQSLEGYGGWADFGCLSLPGSVHSVAFSPDSKRIASGSGDNKVRICDVATWTLQRTLEGHRGAVYSVAFSPDSKLLASGSHDGTVKIWDAATGTLQQSLEGHSGWVDSYKGPRPGPIRSVVFSPDSKSIAWGSDDNKIRICDVATWALQQTLEGHDDSVRSVAFSSDSKLLASGSHDGTVKIWDAALGTLQRTLDGPHSAISSVSVSRDSKLVASGSYNNLVTIWDTATWTLQQTLKGHLRDIRCVAFSPDSKLVASGSNDDTVKVWDAAVGSSQKTLERHSDFVASLGFSPDSKFMASGSRDNTVKIWDTATGTLQQTLEGHDSTVYSIAFSPDSKLMASASWDTTVKIWDTATWVSQQTLKGHNDALNSVAFSPDSKLIASGSDDSTAKIWDITTGTLQRTLERQGSIWSIAFSPDSKLIALGFGHGIVEIWDKEMWALQQTLKEHSGLIHSMAFSSDSKFVVSASRDNALKTWNVATGALQQTLGGYNSWVVPLSFSGSGSMCSDLEGPGSYGVSNDRSWITWNAQKLLWLPPDCRCNTSAIVSFLSPPTASITRIGLGMLSGKVTIMGLEVSGPYKHACDD